MIVKSRCDAGQRQNFRSGADLRGSLRHSVNDIEEGQRQGLEPEYTNFIEKGRAIRGGRFTGQYADTLRSGKREEGTGVSIGEQKAKKTQQESNVASSCQVTALF